MPHHYSSFKFNFWQILFIYGARSGRQANRLLPAYFSFFILYLLKREKDTCEWLLLIFMRLRNQLTVRRTRHGHLPPLLHFLILFSLFLSFGFIFTYLMDWCWDLVWSAPCSRWSYRGFRSEHSLKRPTPANQTFP